MKKKTLLMMLLMLTCFGTTRANIVEIGDGTDDVTSDVLPTRARFEYSLTQQIYTGAEIGMTGTINSIAFYKASEGTATRVLDIYMSPTDKTSYPGSLDWEHVTADYMVFSGEVTFEPNAWTAIPLSVPYEYYDKQNLVVTVNDRTAEYTAAKASFRAISAPGASLFINNESVAYNPVEDMDTYIATVGDQKCSIQLDITPVKAGNVKVGGGLKASYMLPANRGSKYALTQQIYTASELGTAGTIKKISFKTSNKPWSTNGGSNNVDIYMVHTAKYSFSNAYDWIDFSEADMVYSGYISHYRNNTIATVTLQTPFEYDGYSNIALIVVQHNGAMVSGPYVECLTFDAPNQALVSFSNDTPYVPTLLSTYEGTLLGGKNQIWFNIVPSVVISGSSTTGNAPIYTASKYGFSEQVYSKEQVGQSGVIYSLSFFCKNQASDPGERTRQIDVYLQNTNVSQLSYATGWILDNWQQVDEENKVFSGSVTLEEGWNKITLDKPFRYNGYDSNLLVAIKDNTGTAVTNYSDGASSTLFDSFDTGSGREQVLYIYGDNDIDIASLGEGDGILSKSKPKLRIGFGDTWQIGEGMETTDKLPFEGKSLAAYVTQQIYTPDEIGEDDVNITSLSFKYVGNYMASARTIDIYLTDPTYKESYENETDWAPVREEDMVFSGKVEFTNNEWTDIPLSRPFHYSKAGGGLHYLAVTIVDKPLNFYESTDSKFLCFEAEGQAIYATRSYHEGYFTPEELGSSTSGTVLNYKNQIQFNNVPLAIRPINFRVEDVTLTTASFKWNAPTTEVSSYNLQYKPKDATDWTKVAVTNPAATSYTLTGLAAKTEYTCRLQMVNGSDLSDWAETSFSTDLQVTNIEYDATYNSAVVTWDGPGTMWDFQYKRYEDTTWKGEFNLTEKSYTMTGLEEGGYYYVRVRVTDGNDHFGSWSESSFVIPARYPQPNDLNVGTVTMYSAELTWEETGTAKAWQICVNDDMEHLIEVDEKYCPDGYCARYILAGLESGKHYDVKVRSVYPEDGAYSEWSYSVSFETQTPNPVPSDITIAALANSATLSWKGESDSYEVRYRKAAEFLYQDFENGLGYWSSLNLSPNSGINYGHEFYFSYYYSGYQYLISPELKDLPSGATFSFRHHSWGVKNSFKVGYSTTSSDVTDPTAFTWTDEMSTEDWDWHDFSMTLPAGVKYIAFENYADINNMYGSLYLDDISITLPGAEPGEWMSVEVDKRNATLTDLQAETVYQYQIIGRLADYPDAETDIRYFMTSSDVIPSIFGDLTVETTPTTAQFDWKGNFDMYKLEYRTAEKGVTIEQDNIYFKEDFESTFTWTTIDTYVNSGVISNIGVDGGAGFIFETGGMYPSQYILQAVGTTYAPGSELKFVYKGDAFYMGDGLSVGYSTTDYNLGSFVWEPISDFEPSTDWKTYSMVLPDNVQYIAFQWSGASGSVTIDDVMISYHEIISYMEPAGPWQTVWTNEPTALITGLEKGTTYDYRMTCIYLGGGESTTGIWQFTTPNEAIDIALDAKGLNEGIISANADVYADVTIQNLTLKKDGQWQSICLPFNLNIEGSVLDGAEVRTYEDARLYIASGFATLDFLTPVTKIKAGQPYIIKWNSGADIVDPTFEGVTIRDNKFTITFGNEVSFVPNYDVYTVSMWPRHYVLEGSPVLKQLEEGAEVNAFGCYFTSENNYSYYSNTFVLNTGEDEDLITKIASPSTETEQGAIYNVSGQRLGKMQKGINIVNGKKILVK